MRATRAATRRTAPIGCGRPSPIRKGSTVDRPATRQLRVAREQPQLLDQQLESGRQACRSVGSDAPGLREVDRQRQQRVVGDRSGRGVRDEFDVVGSCVGERPFRGSSTGSVASTMVEVDHSCHAIRHTVRRSRQKPASASPHIAQAGVLCVRRRQRELTIAGDSQYGGQLAGVVSWMTPTPASRPGVVTQAPRRRAVSACPSLAASPRPAARRPRAAEPAGTTGAGADAPTRRSSAGSARGAPILRPA
jgi:hypothetical protein